MPPRIPPEVVDHILDNLELPIDYKSLCASTLVCSEWLFVARNHLFSTIHLREDSLAPRRNAKGFFHIVRLSPGIGLAVKSLSVKGSLSVLSSPVIPFDDIISLLGQLSHLQHLTLSHMNPPSSDTEFPTTVPHPMLRTLSLTSLCYRPGQISYGNTSILRFLDLFSNVNQVRIERVDILGHKVLPSSVTLSHLAASSIVLGSETSSNQTFLDILRLSPTLQFLTELDVTFARFTNVLPNLCSLLGDRKCVIRTLTLRHYLDQDSWSKEDPNAAEDAVQELLCPTLQGMYSLRSFRIFVEWNREDALFWDVCPSILRALPSASIEELHFYYSTLRAPVDLDFFDGILQMHAHLRMVCVYAPWHRGAEVPVRTLDGGKVVRFLHWEDDSSW